MGIYVELARKIAAHDPLGPWEVTHPLGYPALLAFLISGAGSLARAVKVQIVISGLVPPALGLLGIAAYGRRTGLLATVFGSLYFPFIEYGALFLTEIHFVFWMTLAFAGFLGARRLPAARSRHRVRGGRRHRALDRGDVQDPRPARGVRLLRRRRRRGRPARAAAPAQRRRGRARLKPWVLRGAVAVLAAAPVLGVMSRTCTRASGRFCITGKEMGHDFLLGHYGRIADVEWDRAGGPRHVPLRQPELAPPQLRAACKVPFSISDPAANRAEAWRWIAAHPGEAIVLSLDHVYDTLFGPVMWPTMNNGKTWTLAATSQFAFILLLFVPTVLALARVTRRGLRRALASRTALVFAPIAALLIR